MADKIQTNRMLPEGDEPLELSAGHKTGQLAVIDHDEFMKNLNKASRKLVEKGEK